MTLSSPLFFISKKVQVEAPEPEPGGNAWNFIKIFNYRKLKIGLWRDFRDFAIFLIYFRFFWGSISGPLDLNANTVTVWPQGRRGRKQKIF